MGGEKLHEKNGCGNRSNVASSSEHLCEMRECLNKIIVLLYAFFGRVHSEDLP
jgi:hypothetical protein